VAGDTLSGTGETARVVVVDDVLLVVGATVVVDAAVVVVGASVVVVEASVVELVLAYGGSSGVARSETAGTASPRAASAGVGPTPAIIISPQAAVPVATSTTVNPPALAMRRS
jgi:hypothetical protein